MGRSGWAAWPLLVLLAFVGSVGSVGVVGFARADDQAGYSREVKRAAAGHLAALGLILRREVPYTHRAADHAAALLAIAASGREIHPPAPDTLDSADVMDERIAFDGLLDAWLDASQDLDRAARSGALADIAPAYRDVAVSCKACHDRFRVRVGGR